MPRIGNTACVSLFLASIRPPAALSVLSRISTGTDYLFTQVCQTFNVFSISIFVSIENVLRVSPRIVDTTLFYVFISILHYCIINSCLSFIWEILLPNLIRTNFILIIQFSHKTNFFLCETSFIIFRYFIRISFRVMRMPIFVFFVIIFWMNIFPVLKIPNLL